MIYLNVINFPSDHSHVYPYTIPAIKDLGSISFSPITIFAGSNGSGKSTIINAIAEKLSKFFPTQKSLGNTGGYFKWFSEHCTCNYDARMRHTFPASCRLIKSEDIMDGIITQRKSNEKIEMQSNILKRKALSDYDDEEQFGINKRDEELTDSQRFYRSLVEEYRWGKVLENTVQTECSNGESAINYFSQSLLTDDSLFLLDEPENSLAPKLQVELIQLIQGFARFYKCQFIIATHSPFLLSLKGAKIYDLDKFPVKAKNWHELDNMRAYAKLFFENEKFF